LLRGLLVDRTVPHPRARPLDDVVVAVVAMRYFRRRLAADELQRRWVGTPESFLLLLRLIGVATATARWPTPPTWPILE
jgi:hypothetical protein